MADRSVASEDQEGGCPPPSSSSGFGQFPVRYSTGEVRVIGQDLSSEGLFPWGHTRSYSNQLTAQNEGVNSNSWFVAEMPQLVQVSATRICLTQIIQEALWFDLVGTTWVPKFFVQDTLVQDTIAHEFIHTDTRGRVTKFYAFDAPEVARRGQFKSFKDPAGNLTVVNYLNDWIDSFVQTSGSKTAAYYYQYIAAGQTNAGKLQFVTLQVDGNNVRRCQYDYYGSNEAYGLLGDLKRVTVQEWTGSSWTPSGTSYYRYYKTDVAPGFAHGLQYIAGKYSYAMMVARGITLEIALPEQIAQYADNYFEYDNPADRRAVVERVGGGTLTFNY